MILNDVYSRLSICLIWTVFFVFIQAKSPAQGVTERPFAATITIPLLSVGTIALQPGIQYQFAKKWAVVSELGVPLVRLAGSDFEKVFLLRWQNEVKYLTTPSAKQQGYLSLQVGYLFRKLTNNGEGYYYANRHHPGSDINYFSATATSPVLFSTLKIGVENRLRNDYFLDWSFGLGVRYINTHYAAQITVPASFDRKDNALFDNSYKIEGEIIRPHGTVALRFGKYF